MSEIKRKPPYISYSLVRNIKKAKKKGVKTIKTYSRASTIIPEMIGLIMMVHNGKEFIPVSISPEMIGKKLGEFSLTRVFKGHAGSKKGGK